MYGNPYFMQQQRFQPMTNQTMPAQQYMPQTQPIQQQQVGLLGKIVDSIDVVKASEIPMDGSTSFFPLADGSAIVTKQLQTDGTSKTTIYKPVQDEQKELPKYATIEDVKREIEKIDLTELDDIKEDIKEMKKEFKNIKKSKED